MPQTTLQQTVLLQPLPKPTPAWKSKPAPVRRNAMIVRILILLFLGFLCVGNPSYAQDTSEGIFKYLRSEPMTLFDAGMKSLRKQSLETAAYFTAKPTLDATARVAYNPTVQNIEITLDIETGTEVFKKRCVDLRKQAILKLLRIGLSHSPSHLTMKERIMRRLGGQFAHEPNGSIQDFIALGSRLAKVTYFSIKLTAKDDPSTTMTCRGLITDSLTSKF
ncbi:MAG: hypothetical protein OQK24_05560 [Magnetovibrio sp.]|nr:hypothetical protein [Magnetovibrio sp.]